MTKTDQTGVLITTKHRGVFFGYLKETLDEGRTVVLNHARCAIRFRTTGGFLELADVGPNSKSRIGSKAPEITLYDVTSIAECTPKATKAWIDHE